MSYTIQSTPESLSSLHGDLIYCVAYPEHTSDPVTYTNFKFIGDVYVGTTMVARLKKIPDPVTNIGIFNISNIVRNYLATTFNPAAATFVAQILGTGEFNLKVTMKFGEEYGFTAYTNLVTDSERTFFNNYNAKDFVSSLTGLSNKPLTSRPSKTFYNCDSAFNFFPYFAASTDPFTITVNTYEINGSFWTGDSVVITPTANTLYIFNLTEAALNQAMPDLMDDVAVYFTVEVGGVTFRFDKKCECIHEVYRLHFLNKYGGFESKDFDKVSRKTISIERKDFGKLPYTVDPSGQVSYKTANNVYNESRSVYSSQFKERLTLNSDLLTDSDYTWLEQLVLSPMVYLEQGGIFYPVVISESNYEPKKFVNDELTNLTLSVEFGNTGNAQYR